MAYQSSYGPPPMYNPGTGQSNSASSHFPHQQFPPQQLQQHQQQQQPQSQHQYQQQQQPFYPNPYPQPSGPVSTYGQPAPSPDGQGNLGPRQQYPPFQHNGSTTAGAPLMQQPSSSTMVPDDPFKKPYLPPQKSEPPRHTTPQMPQQLYTQKGRFFLPFSEFPYVQTWYEAPADYVLRSLGQSPVNSYPYNQQYPGSTVSSVPSAATSSPQKPSLHTTNAGASNSTTSSMTVSAPPANSSAQTTPTSEGPSQAIEANTQATRLSPLDQERVDALLNVNNLLLQELQILQKLGLKQPAGNPQSPQGPSQTNASSPQAKVEGGAASPKPTDPSTGVGANPTTTSSNTTPTTTTPTTSGPPQYSLTQKKFFEYMNRLKSNIMFLVTISDGAKQKQRLPYPTHLETLPNWLAEGIREEDKPQLEALKESYVRLRGLFPDWKPGQHPAQAQGASQQQTGLQQSQLQAQAHQQSQSRT